MKNKSILFPIVCMMFLCLPLLVKAQNFDDLPDVPPDPDAVPIDGGLSILLAAGVGYGVKKVYQNRKKKGDTVDYNDVK